MEGELMMSDNEQQNEKRKTVCDIVAIVRRAAQYYDGEAEKSEGLLRETFKLSAANYREIANLVETSWKREREAIEREARSQGKDAVLDVVKKLDCIPSEDSVGNAAAMREAVVALLDAMYIIGCDENTAALAASVPDMADSSAKCLAAIRKAKTALSAPSRQCDVGTAEEQDRRMTDFCNSHNCEECPVYNSESCSLAWAQMPYDAQEGGAK